MIVWDGSHALLQKDSRCSRPTALALQGLPVPLRPARRDVGACRSGVNYTSSEHIIDNRDSVAAVV
jgi:hypothetical protein